MNVWDDVKSTQQNLDVEIQGGKKSKLIVRREDVELRKNDRRGNLSSMIITAGKGFHIQTMDCRMSELPPGRNTNTHRHRSEALIHFLQGRGHSLMDGQRIDWKAGDTLFIPSWVWHNFCNDDPEQPVRYLAITNRPLLYGLGVEGEEKQKND